jgi:hypothetical protein
VYYLELLYTPFLWCNSNKKEKENNGDMIKIIIVITYMISLKQQCISNVGPSCPWTYDRWIYNYLCNECLSPLMVWVQISIRARCAPVLWLRVDMVEVAQEANKATCLFLSVPFYKYYGPESNTNLLMVCFTNMHNIWRGVKHH